MRWRHPVLNTYRDFEPGIYAEDTERVWSNSPNYRGVYHSFFEDHAVATNSLGFRGAEVAAGAGPPLRVLALGDSNTFGHGVADAETFPVQLERELGQHGHAAVVWNAGVFGYNTAQELSTLRRFGPALRPTVVTLGWLENDLGEPAPTTRVMHGYLVERERDVELLRERLAADDFWDRSYLVRLVSVLAKIRRARARLSEQRLLVDPPLASLERNLPVVREIRRVAHELGARLIVIVYVGQSAIVQHTRSEVVAHIEAVLRSEGVETLSIYDLFTADFDATGRDLYVVRDRGHPNVEGHALTARTVADLILR